jgi:hypothetical protein
MEVYCHSDQLSDLPKSNRWRIILFYNEPPNRSILSISKNKGLQVLVSQKPRLRVTGLNAAGLPLTRRAGMCTLPFCKIPGRLILVNDILRRIQEIIRVGI